jgi:hypothetical protein
MSEPHPETIWDELLRLRTGGERMSDTTILKNRLRFVLRDNRRVLQCKDWVYSSEKSWHWEWSDVEFFVDEVLADEEENN